MSTPNILSDLSSVIIKPSYSYGQITSATAYGTSLLGVGYSVPNNKVVRIVNLMISVGNANSLTDDGIRFDIGVNEHGTSNTTPIFTNHLINSHNTVCLLDEATPLILEPGQKLLAACTNGSLNNFYIAYETIENA